MTDMLDILFGDDEAHVLRALIKRIDALESSRINDVQSGMIVDWGLNTKSGKWSASREDSVGANYTRWWMFDDINTTQTYEEVSMTEAWRGQDAGSGTPPLQGQVGGLTGKGSYAVKFVNGGMSISFPVVAMPGRGWTIEATFRPDTLPATNGNILASGFGNTGQGFTVSNGSGGSGSLLCVNLPGVATYSTGITLVAGNWYHAIAVSDSADNNLKWYVGTLNPVTKAFSITTGSTAVGASIAPNAVGLVGGNMDATIDNFLLYTGMVAGGTAEKSAEDRIRNAVQPQAPKGFVAADGAAVARNRYDRLFRIYGTSHGAGDGSTTFNLPNFPGCIIKE